MRLDTSNPFPGAASGAPTATLPAVPLAFPNRAIRRHRKPDILARLFVYGLLGIGASSLLLCGVLGLGALFRYLIDNWSEVWPVLVAVGIIAGGWGLIGLLFYTGLKTFATGLRDWWHAGH